MCNTVVAADSAKIFQLNDLHGIFPLNPFYLESMILDNFTEKTVDVDMNYNIFLSKMLKFAKCIHLFL